MLAEGGIIKAFGRTHTDKPMPSPMAAAASLSKDGAGLYPELDAGVYLPRHHHRPRCYLIMSRTSFSTLSHYTLLHLYSTMRADRSIPYHYQALWTNATSRTHTAHIPHKAPRIWMYGPARWMVLAYVVPFSNDNQRNSQVHTANFLGFGARQIQYDLVSY
ncbi:hypothetical protein BGW80DRAFT_193416 [Lactifluus volemus]|nr:hypothetical protein BGW80DRAFT_193416 [Lactifluus volemus]